MTDYEDHDVNVERLKRSDCWSSNDMTERKSKQESLVIADRKIAKGKT